MRKHTLSYYIAGIKTDNLTLVRAAFKNCNLTEERKGKFQTKTTVYLKYTKHPYTRATKAQLAECLAGLVNHDVSRQVMGKLRKTVKFLKAGMFAKAHRYRLNAHKLAAKHHLSISDIARAA